MTPGQKLVRRNPKLSPADTEAELLKEKTAVIIDIINGLEKHEPRLAAIARTKYEEAVMWAVKLATAPYWQQQKTP